MDTEKNMSPVRKLTISGIVVALYVVIMFFTQSFAFMQYQIRIATALYSLSAIFPFLVLPLGVANLLSNVLMGTLGPLDAIGGFLVGCATAWMVRFIREKRLNDMLIALPIIFIPGLVVPIWLSYLLRIPYVALTASLCIGQILPGLVGALVVKVLGRIRMLEKSLY